MSMLILEATGSDGERLAMAASEKTGIAVGWDEEFNSATFDSDLEGNEMQLKIFAALDEIDPAWRIQLQVVEDDLGE
jgi:hypothetical protein